MQKRRLATCLVAALLVLVLSAVSPAARADVITDWNETGVTAVVAGGLNGLAMSPAMAMIHAAMHDAVNGVERRYTSYGADIKAPPGASREAAASAAAYTVLSRLLWLQTPVFDAMLEASLARIADGPAKTDGLAVGKAAAEKILALRANDGANGSAVYTHRTGLGMYQPTPPVNPPPVMPHWATVRPFTLKSPDQIPVKGPAPYDSAEFARDFAEVKLMGAKNSPARTREQTETARFWSISGIVTDNAAARQVAIKKATSVTDNARIFALLNMAGADAYIACWEAKYRLQPYRRRSARCPDGPGLAAPATGARARRRAAPRCAPPAPAPAPRRSRDRCRSAAPGVLPGTPGSGPSASPRDGSPRPASPRRRARDPSRRTTGASGGYARGRSPASGRSRAPP